MKKRYLTRAIVAVFVLCSVAMIRFHPAVAQETEQHGDHDGHDHGELQHSGEIHEENEMSHDPDGHETHEDHEDHTDHEDHVNHEDQEVHEEHEGEDDHEDAEEHEEHGDHEGHEDHGLTMSSGEKRRAGLVIAQAGPGDLHKQITLRGEVRLNEDRVAHVVSLVPGICRETSKTVGDNIEEGEVLVILESGQLGEAKLDFLKKVNEALRYNIIVPRVQKVHDNTIRLLSFLDENPSSEELRSFHAGETGENVGSLIGTYARLTAARRTWEREKDLYEKNVTSEQEYLSAKAEYETAAAEYMASRDSIAFEVKQTLFEEKARLRAARFDAETAKHRLQIMGIDDEEIQLLNKLALPEETGREHESSHSHEQISENNHEHYFDNGFKSYSIRSSRSGVILEKNIVPGEKVSDGDPLFKIADTGSLWVDLMVHLKDMDLVSPGDEVSIHAEHSSIGAKGRISMLSPVLDKATRTMTARVLLDNEAGKWRPGMFVTGRINVSAEKVPVVTAKDAVQVIDGEHVVFVPEGESFITVPVKTGRSDREHVEITAGLEPGASYVAEGAFNLKAKLVTSSLDSHAGHGH